jgi:hypothetical protein
MRRTIALFLLLATPAGGTRAADGSALSEEEKTFCHNEIEIVVKRRKIFEAQGLSDTEIERRNRSHIRDLADCHDRFLAGARRAAEDKEDADELARRAGPNATPLERYKASREIRRERLASRSASSLTPEEKAELAAGMAEEMEATHAMLDTAHSRDPSFMRIVHSALACYHGERRAELTNLISSEESLLKLGSGDKQALYALRSELRSSDEVLARCRDAARGYGGGLESCNSPAIALLAHCMGIVLTGKAQQPACEPEEIQQYVRLVK